MRLTFASCLLVLAAPAIAQDHWLDPLAAAAQAALDGRSEVQEADLASRRAGIGVAQAASAWNPRLDAGLTADQQVERSNDSTEVGTSTEELFRQREDYEIARQLLAGRSPSFFTTPGVNEVIPAPTNPNVRTESQRGELGLSQPLSTGTELGLRLTTTRDENNRANALLRESWVSRVRFTLTQQLLRGFDRDANLADQRGAESDLEAARDDLAEALERAYAELAQDWLDLGRTEAELADATADLAEAEADLHLASERQRAGLAAKGEVLVRQRDVTELRATLGRRQRAVDGARRRLELAWANHRLPPPPGAEAQPVAIAAPAFADTRAGRDAARDLADAERALMVARDAGRDQLALELGAGLSGRASDFGRSFGELATGETFDWSVGLRFTRTLGSDRARLELGRAQLEYQRAEHRLRRAEREWLLELDRLQRGFTDATARIDEQAAVLAALEEERELVAAEVETGIASVRDLLDVAARARQAEVTLIGLRFDALASELDLRAHCDALSLPLMPTPETTE